MKSAQPFFSIILPTFNRAKWLRTSIQSILAQEFTDYEVIVVDDGSTDDSGEVVNKLSEFHPQIRYFYKQNEERSIARNFGISKATGRYVGFLDSDDKLYPNHLTTAFDLLKRNGFPEVGHLGYEMVDEQGHSILVRNSFDQTFKSKLIRENILHGNAIVIRKDILQEIHFIPSTDAVLSEDWYLWLRLAARYPFYFDNTVTSAVLHHPDRSLLNINPVKLISNTRTIVSYLEQDITFLSTYKNQAFRHFADHYTFLTLTLAHVNNRRWDTLQFLVKAFHYDPGVVFRKRFWASIKHWFYHLVKY